MVSAAEARSIYRAFIRESTKFPNYNIREYIKRRAREAFGTPPPPGSTTDELFKVAKQEMEVVKRQSLVYNLYARKHKSVMELEKAS